MTERIIEPLPGHATFADIIARVDRLPFPVEWTLYRDENRRYYAQIWDAFWDGSEDQGRPIEARWASDSDPDPDQPLLALWEALQQADFAAQTLHDGIRWTNEPRRYAVYPLPRRKP